MEKSKFIAKWGFGMAPISERMQKRYDDAVQTTLDLFDGNLSFEEVNLDAISELKGMFNRCIRQDQWDWFSVFTELGTPPYPLMCRIVEELVNLRSAIKEKNIQIFEKTKFNLINYNILHYLAEYQSEIIEHTCDPTTGWIYILSTREQPDILKIGMTHRSISQRVREINSATAVLIPFAARQVFRVKNAKQAEKDIFKLLADYRLRSDREFFKIPFSIAQNEIRKYIYTNKMRLRRKGIVLWFDKQKKYGFISMDNSGDVFLHYSQIKKDCLDLIKQGEKVEFDLGMKPQGLFALDVDLIQPII